MVILVAIIMPLLAKLAAFYLCREGIDVVATGETSE